jgi:urea transporter
MLNPEGSARFHGLQANPWGRFLVAVLKAPGQVVFQDNVVSGVVVLVGIAIASWVAALDFVLGAAIATAAATALRADTHATELGLFGFSGGYVGLLVGVFADQGVFPGPVEIVFFIVLGAILAVPLTAGLVSLFGRVGLSPTALPILLLVWFILAAVAYTDLSKLPVAPGLFPVDQASGNAYDLMTYVEGIGNGFAQIFAQVDPVAGYVIVLAIFLNSPIAGAMGLAGAALGIGVPMLLGFDEAMVRTGTMAFNPALTAIGLGGFFIVLSLRTSVYALLGAVLSIWLFIALSAILAQVGLPAMTIGMVVTIALLVLGAQTFDGMRVVPLDHLRPAERWLRDRDGRSETTT